MKVPPELWCGRVRPSSLTIPKDAPICLKPVGEGSYPEFKFDPLGSSICSEKKRKERRDKKTSLIMIKRQIDQDPISGHFLVNIICHNLFDPFIDVPE